MTPLDALSLDGTSGLATLLRRALASCAPGAILEVVTRSRSGANDLPALVKAAGHLLEGRREEPGPGGPAIRFRVRRGELSEVARPEEPEPGHAPIDSGFALRGTQHEGGAPHVPFGVDRADRAWLDEARALYEQAVAAQWSADRDIAWPERDGLPPDLAWAVAQLFSFLAENEVSALLVPAGFLPRVHPHLAEVSLFLGSRIFDEARHLDAFRRRSALAGAAQPIYSTRSTRASLLTLVEERDFTTAEFLLGVLGEGSFLELLRFIEVHAPDPLTAELCRRARLDEARHVRFAMAHVRARIEAEPALASRLAAAAHARKARLDGAGTLSPFVDDALAVLAAGGLDPERLPAGVDARVALHAEMAANRARRLSSIGFDGAAAEAIAAAHTPNIM